VTIAAKVDLGRQLAVVLHSITMGLEVAAE